MAPGPDDPDHLSAVSATAEGRDRDGSRRGEVTIARLFRSPLAVRVTLAVFVSIMIVEAVILLPSYLRQEEHLLEDLRSAGAQWVMASEGAYTASGDPAAYAQAVLRAPLVAGVAVLDGSGRSVAAAGEAVQGQLTAGGWVGGAFDAPDGPRHEWAWTGADSPIGSTVVLRLDRSGVAEELRAYVLRILGLVVIVTAALTAATMIAMGAVVLRPLVALSNALAEGEDRDWSGRRLAQTQRSDEIGDVFRATAALLAQLGASRRDLEARVEARTAELREVNARLVESESRFRDFTEASSDFYWEMDENLRFSFFSDRFTDVTGVPPERLLGLTQEESPIPGIDPEVWRRHLETMAAHQPFRNFVHTRTRRDGTTAHIAVSGTPVFDGDGRFTGYRGIGADITASVAAERELADKEALLRLALDNMTDGIYVLDRDLRYLTYNDRYFDLLGVSYDELQVGKPVADVVSRLAEDGFYGPGDPKALAQERLAFIASPEEAEIEVTTKSGRILLVRKSPLDDGGAVITLTDMTERAKAERALHESQQRLQSLIDNSPSEIVIKDTDLRYVQVNRIFEEHYGVARADVVGKVVRDVLPASMADAIEVQDAAVMKSGNPVEMELDAVVHGETRINLESKFPIPDDQGNIIGIAGIAADITERKRSERELEKAKEAADAANKAKSDLLAMVSHEIRTPMNGALGMARLLWETDLDDDQQECVDTIVASGEALVRIVDDLLDASKLEAGALHLEAIPFIAGDVVERAVGVMAARASEKGLTLTRAVDAAIPPVVIGDPLRLRQILLNLISNAIKFTSKGSVAVDAALVSRDGDKAVVRFAVADTGQGIRPATQKKLFAPYTQGTVEVARKYGGTGLGLTICRRLAELMGSEIVLESTYGKGSTFRADIPLAIDRTTDAVTLRESQATRHLDRWGDQAPGRSLTVLQVEDNAINREVAERILSRVGHEVVSVANGVEALRAIQERRFDIVLMDRHMPEMNGVEATRKIRAMDPPVNAIPIIGVTAAAGEADVAACLQAGMDTVLIKPLRTKGLRAAVARLAAPAPEHAAIRADSPVLVVDDVKTNRSVTRRQLDQLAVASELAESGGQALEMLKAGHFGAVLVDVSMPEMDGVEFTRRLRERETELGRRTPVIAMTGHVSPDDRARLLDAGMDDCLTKPVVLRDLGAILGKWLGRGDGARRDDPGAWSPPAGDGGDRPPIDMGLLGEILGEDGDNEKYEWVDRFVDEASPLLGSIDDAIAGKDRAATADAAHAAKSAASCAAAVPLTELLQRLELEARSAEWPDIASMAEAAKAELRRVAGFRHGSSKGA